MNDIQKLKDRRERLTSEVERLRAELLHYETALAAPESIQRGRERDVQDQYADRKRKCDSLDFEINQLNQKIVRRENIANHETLMAGYRDAMATWKADEHELNEKRQPHSRRGTSRRAMSMNARLRTNEKRLFLILRQLLAEIRHTSNDRFRPMLLKKSVAQNARILMVENISFAHCYVKSES